ncbi:glycosyltransferase [Planctomycetota bacterium]
MNGRTFFFAGGGTGGHIYPAIAVASKISKLDPSAKIHFFCSDRDIDAKILAKTNFQYTALPARGLALRPDKLIKFITTFFKSTKIARGILNQAHKPVVTGIGGFAAAPACYVAHELKIPLALINTDLLPGKANRIIARWADQIFIQFEDTIIHLPKTDAKFSITGCPLRAEFANPQPEKAIKQLALDKDKNILLITGASSGARNINNCVCSLLEKLDEFADSWQMVHLTGAVDFEQVKEKYSNTKITHKVLAYHDDMADLLSAADLLIGRSGAVSIAEYTATETPSICMPYPYHKDQHQYYNAAKLVEVGAAIIVDDVPDAGDRAEWLWEELQPLMNEPSLREKMKSACTEIAKKDAAKTIAKKLLAIS